MEKDLIPSRLAHRATDDLNEVLAVLEEARFCTLSYSLDGKTGALPTGYCLIDNRLIIHGSGKSAFLDHLLQAGQVCITAFLFDALVLASSAFEHSVNYRSVVIFSVAEELTEPEQKFEALYQFTERYVPGRWPQLRPMTPAEVSATRVLAFDLNHASMKERTGPPSFPKDGWEKKVWTGLLPVSTVFNDPIPLENAAEELDLPDHVSLMIAQIR